MRPVPACRTSAATLARIVDLAAGSGVRVQTGGGIRSEDDVAAVLDLGVARVVMGTAALADPPLATRCARRWPARVAVGLDYVVRPDGVAEARAHGWEEGSGRTVPELLALWSDEPIGAVVATAIARDGMLGGSDLAGLRALLELAASERALPVIASGGVGTLDDLRDLAALVPSDEAGRRDRRQGPGRGAFQREGGGGRMRSVRLIPCLDVTDGRVVKGVRFVDLTDEGDPVELAARYDAEGADELTFLDITASSDGRDTMVSVVARTAEQVFIPLTVGGGVRETEDARRLLRAGADKVAVNTAAVERPTLVRDIADEFGTQCAVVAIDARARVGAGAGWQVYTHGGRRPTELDVVAWASECAANGAGRDPPHLHGPGRHQGWFRPGAHRHRGRRRGDPRGGIGGRGDVAASGGGGHGGRGRCRAGGVHLPSPGVHPGPGQGLYGRTRGDHVRP